MQPTTPNTLNLPASPEVVSASQENLRRAAMEQATSMHSPEQPTDAARGLGASTVAAAEKPAATPELVFDPTNPEQLILCGRGVLKLRALALGQQ